MSALRGLQHLFVASRSCPADQLGTVLAVMRVSVLGYTRKYNYDLRIQAIGMDPILLSISKSTKQNS